MKPQLPQEPSGSVRPPGIVEGLIYNRSSETLVAIMRGGRKGLPVQRLYYRRLPEHAYRPVGVRHELESQQDAHCCEAAPFLIFNEMRFEQPRPAPPYLQQIFKGKPAPPGGWGSNWLGIRRFDLETGEDQRVLDAESLNPPPPYSSGWVSRIMSVSGDGSLAVCTVGLSAGGHMEYFVFEVSLAKGLVRKIAELPGVFL
jgi:hypothetical protein